VVRRRKMAIHKKGVARFVIVVILAVIALGVSAAPVYAGVSPGVGRAIGDATNGTSAIIGETNLIFVDSTGALIPSGALKGDWDNSKPIRFPNSGSAFDSSKEAYLEEGRYEITGDNGKTTTIYFYFPTFFPYSLAKERDVPTQVNGYDFDWVSRGGDITLKADTNLNEITGPLPTIIAYKLFDPRGARLYEVNGVPLSNISIDSNGDNSLTINTAGMRIGTYTLNIETDPETNNGLDTESLERSFEVRSKGVTIVAEPQEQSLSEEIFFTVTTMPYTNLTLNLTQGIISNVAFASAATTGTIFENGGYWLSGKSTEDGIFKVEAVFLGIGFYEITATEHITNTQNDTGLKIVREEVTLDQPEEGVYHIGEVLTIKGKAPSTGEVTIMLDDTFFGNVSVDDFKSGIEWDTAEYIPGTYRIKIWYLPQSNRDPPDASVSLVLIPGGLLIETVVPFVALGDDFEIERIIVPGGDRVDILTIAPDGGGGRGFDPIDILTETSGDLDAPGLAYYSYTKNTEDDEFTTDDMEKIKVAEDVDTGTYLIVALNYGRDGEWGRSETSNLLSAISVDYTTPLGVKPTDSLLAIVKDETIDAPGTDDLLGLTTIKVEPGFVTVDALANVPLGGDITVTGTTNRQMDTAITVTIEGTDERTPSLKPKIAKVETNDKIYYNSFKATFATESANLGEYLVTVNDGNGHTASTTLSIMQAEEPAVNVSATRPPASEGAEVNESVAETPAPTPVTQPTITPSEPPVMESTVLPGFLSLGIILVILWFVIAIIIAVWVYRDATEHGQNGMLWMIIVLLLSVVGLLVWLVKRPKTKE
jgi:hypothetical protein